MRTAPLVLVLALAGCSSFATSASGDAAWLSDTTYSPLPADAPVEITTGDVDEEYEELAILVVRPGPSWLGRSDAETIARMNEQLQMQAREIGAAAVVRVDYNLEGHMKATGTAIRVR